MFLVLGFGRGLCVFERLRGLVELQVQLIRSRRLLAVVEQLPQ